MLINKYYADKFNQAVFAGGSARHRAGVLVSFGDALLIDGLIVNGRRADGGVSRGIARRIQTGYLYHYAFAMILGLLGLLLLVCARNSNERPRKPRNAKKINRMAQLVLCRWNSLQQFL